MKHFAALQKLIRIVVVFVIVLVMYFTGRLSAQADDYANTFKMHGILTLGSSVGSIMTQPGINATFDYKLLKWFSFGFAATYSETNTSYMSFVTGHLQRTNIAGRTLFHIPTSRYLKPYAGVRLGASLWSGNGQIKAVDNIFVVKDGDLLPSVQVLCGLRWMRTQRLGLTAELGLGSPYMASVGVAYVLGKTPDTDRKTWIQSVRADTVPPYRKNVIKLKASTIFGSPGIAYERYLFGRFSFEVGGSATFYKNAFDIQSRNVTESVGNFKEYDSLSKGVRIHAALKRYFQRKQRPFPRGLYAAAQFGYVNQTILVGVEDLQPVPQPILFDYEKQLEMYYGGPIIGYQRPFAKKFTVDIYTGIRFGKTSLKTYRYIDSQVDEQSFQAAYGSHLLPLNSGINAFIFQINIGYMF